MVETLAPMDKSVRLLQLSKARFPMDVMESGIVASVRYMQFSKAPSPMDVTESPSTVALIEAVVNVLSCVP